MWRIDKNPDSNAPDRVRITFPGGFKFDINEPKIDGVKLLAEMVRRGSMLTLPDGQILYMDPDGGLLVFDVDRWLNNGLEFRQSIGNASGLAFVLSQYLVGEFTNE